MKCPLFTTSSIDKGGIIDYKRWECLKAECAWWDDGTPGCSELAKAKSLQKIEGLLFELVNKMPHEGQFRK